MMRTCSSGSARRSNGSARSTRRWTHTARRSKARPDFRKASTGLILALSKSGKGPEAVALARAKVSSAPSDPEACFILGLAQSEVDIADAMASFQRAVSLAPRHSLARYNLALVLRRMDRLPEAIEELERTIAFEPRPQAHYQLGVIRWHQGDAVRAEQSLRAAIALEPGYADAHYTLGAVLRSRGDLKGAAASLRRAIDLRPDTAAHYTLGQVLAQAGDDAGFEGASCRGRTPASSDRARA